MEAGGKRGGKRARLRTAVAIAAVAIVLAAGWFIASPAGARELWFPLAMIDRVSPFAAQATVYAPMPDPDGYFDTYADATGSGFNYVYELRGRDEAGEERVVDLISFGGALGEGDAGDADDTGDAGADWLRIEARGRYVVYFEAAVLADVPMAAREAR